MTTEMNKFDATLYIHGTPFELKGKVSFPSMKNGIPKGKMVAITVDTPKMKKRLVQELNTKDDSFTYTVIGESEPTYKVTSGARLYQKGKHIGDYRLQHDRWHLYVQGDLIESSLPNTLFNLPEFELKSLTALINKG